MLHTAHKTFTHHAAHAAAHEVELKAGGNQVNAAHAAAHDDQRIGLTGVFQRLFQALRVFAAVFELQGVHGQHFLPQFVAAFCVQKGIQTRARANAVMVAALRAHVLVLFQIGAIQHRFAAWALDPQPFWHGRTVLGRSRICRGLGCFGWKQFFKPTHEETPVTTIWRASATDHKALALRQPHATGISDCL